MTDNISEASALVEAESKIKRLQEYGRTLVSAVMVLEERLGEQADLPEAARHYKQYVKALEAVADTARQACLSGRLSELDNAVSALIDLNKSNELGT